MISTAYEVIILSGIGKNSVLVTMGSSVFVGLVPGASITDAKSHLTKNFLVKSNVKSLKR